VPTIRKPGYVFNCKLAGKTGWAVGLFAMLRIRSLTESAT
jgi:hypothetical protein